MPSEELITVAEAATRLGMCPNSLQQAMRRGIFPFGTAWKQDSGRWVYKIPKGQFEKYMSGELLNEAVVERVVAHMQIAGAVPQALLRSRYPFESGLPDMT